MSTRTSTQHVRLVHVAAEEQAQVLVFPELSLTGYELDLADDLAFSQDDPRLAPLVEAASSYSMTLIVGAPVRIGSRLHIGAFIVSPDRTVEVYTKHHLGAFPTSAQPGWHRAPCGSDGLSSRRPEPPRPVRRQHRRGGGVRRYAPTVTSAGRQRTGARGPTSRACSSFRPISRRTPRTSRTYAVRHSMTVVFANYGGPSGGLASGGRSAIWSETGELLAQLEAIGAGVAIAIESPAGWRAKALMSGDSRNVRVRTR